MASRAGGWRSVRAPSALIGSMLRRQVSISSSSCAGVDAAASARAGRGDGNIQKNWRLSASVVVLAPYGSAPDCNLTDTKVGDTEFDYRICFVKRNARSSFMPDVMVFPGGAVDAEDKASSLELLSSAADDAVVRCAAVREVFEESGVGIFEPPLVMPAEERASWRGRVRNQAADIRELCRQSGVLPATDLLLPWCSFITPDVEHGRLRKGGFYTHFFVHCSHATTQGATATMASDASADNQETVELVWLTPGEALAASRAGRMAMAPPQWYIVKELAECCPKISVIPAYATAESRSLQRDYPIKPYPVAIGNTERDAFLQRQEKVGTDEPVFSLCYPGDESHPIFPGVAGSRHRMLIIGKFGGITRYELQRNNIPRLPLVEAKSDWYTLSKL
eukprot:TRINITY_DN51277_c0_g1_i1.p1 TRINITY_DN51277_c0_g1~~TRINITY_DN51277_c0_g1_i1.p1  ORF type:complete len:418 (-),score=49.17 TRINITY_DN51277_c0_g1_i1:109-1287(-)